MYANQANLGNIVGQVVCIVHTYNTYCQISIEIRRP